MDTILKKALINHKNSNYQQADLLYHQVLDIDSHHPDANHNLGLILFANGKKELANNYFKTAISYHPQILQFRISYFQCCFSIEKYEEAILSVLDYQTVCKTKDDWLTFHWKIIEIKSQLDNLSDEAARILVKQAQSSRLRKHPLKLVELLEETSLSA